MSPTEALAAIYLVHGLPALVQPSAGGAGSRVTVLRATGVGQEPVGRFAYEPTPPRGLGPSAVRVRIAELGGTEAAAAVEGGRLLLDPDGAATAFDIGRPTPYGRAGLQVLLPLHASGAS